MFKQIIQLIQNKQNELLIKLTGVLWLCEKLIGWRVWTMYRLFPTVPVFAFLGTVPSQIHLALFVIELILILGLIFLRSNKVIIITLLATEIFSCLLDYNRLQPYEYQCLFMAFVFLVNRNNPKIIPIAVAFILAATYVYSGLGKFNQGFLKTLWENMILHEFLKLPASFAGNHFVYRAGYFLALAEMLAGVGLIFPGTQKKCAIFLMLMHLFILVLIGPLGLNYNVIVWPWNVAMMALLYIVFLAKSEPVVISNAVFAGWNKLVFVLLGILPVLNFAGYWDSYLSSNLYSGKLPKMTIGIGDTTKCMELKHFFKKNKLYYYKGEAVISAQDWAVSEMNTQPYPELRVLRQVADKLEKKYPAAAIKPFFYVNGQMVNNY